MKGFISTLLVLCALISNAQIKINGVGGTVTINAPGKSSTVTINKAEPLPPDTQATVYPIEYKSVSSDYATAISLSLGADTVYYSYLDENDNVIDEGILEMDTGPPLSEIKDSVFSTLSLTDLLDISFTHPPVLNYVAFGGLVHFADQSYAWSGRRGGNHLGGGRINTQPINSLNRSYGTRVIISRPGNDDIRGGSHIFYNGQIYFFASLYMPAVDTFVSMILHKSTDSTGTSWTEDTLLFKAGTNGGVDETTFARFNFYGKPQNKPGTAKWIIPWFEHNGAGTWRPNLLKTEDNLVTYTTHNISQSSVDKIGETYIQYVNGDTLITLGRNATVTHLMQNYSTDFGNTWNGWVETNLGSEDITCMAAMNYSPEYGLMAVYGDRATGNIMITLNNNAANVIANPTSWSTPQILYTVGAGDNFQPLGYPDIERVAQYRFMISFSEELEGGATTNLWIGDGSVKNYVSP